MIIPPLVHLCRALITLFGSAMLVAACSTAEPVVDGPQVKAQVGFALGGGINDLTDVEVTDQIGDLAALGVKWIRVDFGWSSIEQVEGEFDWERSDLVVRAAREHGVNVLALLAYTPRWARPDGTSDKHPPDDVSDFAVFVRAAGERYRGLVQYWEIWNEPNHAPFWEGGIDPEQYADMVNAGGAALRDTVPGAFIVSGGLSPATDDSPSMAPETFITAFLPLVDGGILDGVGMHPYSFPAQPADTTKSWNTFGRLPQIKAMMDEIDPGLAIWLTEYGAPTDQVSEQQQSEEIVEAITCATKWEWAGPLFVYTWRDWTDERFGVVTESGDPKPVFETLRELIAGGTTAQACAIG